MPKRKQTATVHPLAAPVGGLNSRDALAAMPETDAVVLDNFFAQPTWVETRGGYSKLATFTGQCETLMAYNSLSGSNKLFAAVVNGGTRSIFRVDNAAGGSAGSAVVGGGGATIEALTSTRFDYVQFGTGSAEVLYLVNGVDNPLIYDGTSWQAVTTISAPYAITGVTGGPNTLSSVATYKQRLWFLQANTFNVYYLAQNSIAGAATVLNLAPNFSLGGYLQTIITVSIDNSAGTNDYIAFVTNLGEVAVFSGYDPASVSTWSLSAKFRIGRPVAPGRRCWQKMGSDALMIGADGFVLMSEALLTDRSQQRNAVSAKIRKSVTDDISAYANNFGWQVTLYPIGNKLIINVPQSTGSTSYQYVMNTLHGAWTTWNKVNNGYNAFCWELMNDALYFGADGYVAQGDFGGMDGSAAINCTLQQAYSYYGDPTIAKRFTQARPIFVANGSMAASVSMAIDFGAPPNSGSVPVVTGNPTLWGSPWGSPWGDAQILSKNWIGLTGVGIAGSLSIATNVQGVKAQLQGTAVMFEPGGIFA